MIDPRNEVDADGVAGHAAAYLGDQRRVGGTEWRHVRGEREHATEKGSEINAVAAKAVGIAPP